MELPPGFVGADHHHSSIFVRGLHGCRASGKRRHSFPRPAAVRGEGERMERGASLKHGAQDLRTLPDGRIGWVSQGPEAAGVRDIVLWVERPYFFTPQMSLNSVNTLFMAFRVPFSRPLAHRRAL